MPRRTKKQTPRTKKRVSRPVLPLLEELAQAELVRRAADPEPTFVFKNALTQEASYESLLNTRRRELHRRVAQAYAAIYPKDLDSHAALLAYHYEQAGDDVQTLEYATIAGDRAMRVYANAEAITQYDRALNLAKKKTGNTAELIHLYSRRGRACELRGDYAAALGVFGEMYVLARDRSDPRLELEALILLTTDYAVGGFVVNPAQALSLSDDALALARKLQDRQAEARILWNLMLIHRFRPGGTEKAVAYGEQALALARELGLDELRGFILNDLALAYGIDGRFDKTPEVGAEAIATWRARDNKPMLAAALAGRSMNLLLSGHLPEALASGEEALALDESIDNRWGKSTSSWLLALSYREAGRVSRALSLLEQAARLAEEFGIRSIFAMTADLAWTFIALGDLDRGWELTKALMALEPEPGSPQRNMSLALQVHICLLRGDLAAAEARATQITPSSSLIETGLTTPASTTLTLERLELAFARGEFERTAAQCAEAGAEFIRRGAPLPSLNLTRLQGRALLRLGRTEEAVTHLRASRDLALAAGSRFRLWPLLLTLSQAETEAGNTQEAQQAYAQAQETIQSLAGQIDRPELRERFIQFTAARESTHAQP